MNEQLGASLICVAHFTKAKTGFVGLAVLVNVWRIAVGGALTQPVTNAAATEVAQGAYFYELAGASTAVEGMYLFVFSTTDLTADQREIVAGWSVGKAGVEHLDQDVSDVDLVNAQDVAQALVDLGGEVTIVSPVSADGETLTLVRGDHYLKADGRQLAFSSDGWPDLTGITEAKLSVRGALPPKALLFAATDVVADRVIGAGVQSLVFELTAVNTEALILGVDAGKFDVQVLLSNARILTLVLGTVTVLEDQTRTGVTP